MEAKGGGGGPGGGGGQKENSIGQTDDVHSRALGNAHAQGQRVRGRTCSRGDREKRRREGGREGGREGHRGREGGGQRENSFVSDHLEGRGKGDVVHIAVGLSGMDANSFLVLGSFLDTACVCSTLCTTKQKSM